MANTLLALAYDDINPRKAARLRDCATTLSFAVQPDGKRRLRTANFCRVRLCPMCQWRRGLKTYAQLSQIIDYFAVQGAKFAFVFLTLTVRNCTGADLSANLDLMQSSWNRLVGYADFRRAFKGYFKSLEITHNLLDDSYHPHFHVVLAVRPSYFTSRYYLSHDRLAAMWRKAARLRYDPVIDVRRTYGQTAEAVAEASKYAVKVGDYIIPDDWDLSVATVNLLDKALDNRRFLSFGGVFASAKAALRLDDPDDGDLTHLDVDAVGDDDLPVVWYSWDSGYRQYLLDD